MIKESCFKENKSKIKNLFFSLNQREKYELLIKIGSELDILDPSERVLINKVDGCQSQMYVKAFFKNNTINFKMYSDALISAGIARVFQILFNGMSPEEVIKSDLTILKELGILTSLSPSRSNGLIALFHKIKVISLNFLN